MIRKHRAGAFHGATRATNHRNVSGKCPEDPLANQNRLGKFSGRGKSMFGFCFPRQYPLITSILSKIRIFAWHLRALTLTADRTLDSHKSANKSN